MRYQIELLLFATLLISTNAVEPSTPNDANEINQRSAKYTTNPSALYPRATETRDLRTLDGIWNFRVSPTDPEYGQRHGWFEQDLEKTGPVIPMPVPSSYNDLVEDAATRDHVGVVWYDRRFFVPSWWASGQRVWLRFSSVHYAAEVDKWVSNIAHKTDEEYRFSNGDHELKDVD